MSETYKCNLCPRSCNVDRKTTKGYCKAPNKIVVALSSLHMYEEPIISGSKGSGTIFFSYCNLNCIFCQNYEISIENYGQEISINKFKDICLSLQEKGANNINLVTPTCYINLIREGLIKAKKEGLHIPIIYNTSSYENVDALKSLEGLIDVYLPDLKYYSDELAMKYSNCKDYFKYAHLAIKEMYRQTKKPIIKNGLIKKGVIVRHLLLPGHLNDSKKVIKYLHDTYKDNIYISIMNQYTPVRKLEYPNLNRTVTKKEYDSLIEYAIDLNITNAFIQVGKTQEKSFIPNFKNKTNLNNL